MENTPGIYGIAADCFFPDDDQKIAKLAYLIAQKGIPLFHQIFLRFPTVDAVLKRLSNFWKHTHDTGEAHFTDLQLQDKKAIIVITGYPDLPKWFRDYFAGFVQGVGDLTQSKPVTVIPLVAEPDIWKYTVTWQ